jgi:ATP-binding cassette subfamily B protein
MPWAFFTHVNKVAGNRSLDIFRGNNHVVWVELRGVYILEKLRLLWKFMKGTKLYYLGALISVGLSTGFSMVTPLVLGFVVDSVIGDKPMDVPHWIAAWIESLGGRSMLIRNLWICGLILLILTAGEGLFQFLRRRWSAVASESIARNIRESLYDHLQNLPYDYHVKAETGDLVQRCTSDVETIRRFISMQFVELGRAILMVSIALNVMLSIDLRMTLASMAVVPFIFGFSMFFFKRVRKYFQRSDEAEGRLSTVLQESLTGVRVVKAFARQRFEIEKFDERNAEYRDLTYRLIKLMATYWSTSDFLSMLQIGAVLVLGAYWASIGQITLGTVVIFTTYVGMLLWPVRQMGRILADLGRTIVSLGRIKEILDAPLEEDLDEGLQPPIRGAVEFKDVHFEYEEGRKILDGISFRVEPGQTVAILGPTGSGKSSLVHLLQRLFDFQEGSIEIDGVGIRKIQKRWLRKHVGIVLQEPFLFSKTIKENIALSRTGASDEEVYESARVAAIHDVIKQFEKGYDTAVGERGVTLSGGQKQRVAMARTLIRNSPIVIFDDSLSAVDTETDAAIRKALQEGTNKATTFIISHRVNTLAEADLIIVLENGRITQMGSHDELINQEGLYQRIWSIQNALEAELEKELEGFAVDGEEGENATQPGRTGDTGERKDRAV